MGGCDICDTPTLTSRLTECYYYCMNAESCLLATPAVKLEAMAVLELGIWFEPVTMSSPLFEELGATSSDCF